MIAEFVSDFILYWISLLGYAGVLFFMVLESAALPVPSEIIMPFSGYLVYLGKFDMLAVVIAGTLGNVIGSVIAYYVGLFGGRPFIKKYGKYFLLDGRKMRLAEKFFEKHGDKAIFVSRMLPVIRTFISVPAGIGRMNFGKFVLFTSAGSLPWSWLLAYIGFLLGPNWKDIVGFFNQLDVLIIFSAAIVLIYYIKPDLFRSKQKRVKNNPLFKSVM